MTSNIGNEEFTKKQVRIWFAANEKQDIDDKEFEAVKERVLEEMKTMLAPELLNRIDHKIIFKHLNKKTLAEIFKVKVNEFLTSRKAWSDVTLPKFTDKKIKEIIDKIYDPQYGARPVERYIQDEIEPDLVKKILEEKKA